MGLVQLVYLLHSVLGQQVRTREGFISCKNHADRQRGRQINRQLKRDHRWRIFASLLYTITKTKWVISFDLGKINASIALEEKMFSSWLGDGVQSDFSLCPFPMIKLEKELDKKTLKKE